MTLKQCRVTLVGTTASYQCWGSSSGSGRSASCPALSIDSPNLLQKSLSGFITGRWREQKHPSVQIQVSPSISDNSFPSPDYWQLMLMGQETWVPPPVRKPRSSPPWQWDNERGLWLVRTAHANMTWIKNSWSVVWVVECLPIWNFYGSQQKWLKHKIWFIWTGTSKNDEIYFWVNCSFQ